MEVALGALRQIRAFEEEMQAHYLRFPKMSHKRNMITQTLVPSSQCLGLPACSRFLLKAPLQDRASVLMSAPLGSNGPHEPQCRHNRRASCIQAHGGSVFSSHV